MTFCRFQEKKTARTKRIFEDKYTDILLVFDFDPQDPYFDPEHIHLMQRCFCESSDMGKLYLNYPMVEAFYHMSQIPNEAYLVRMATLVELKVGEYKACITRKQKCRFFPIHTAYLP